MTDLDMCSTVEDQLTAILDGTAADELFDHIADCDSCRDLRYDAERAAQLADGAGLDYEQPDDFTTRLLEKARALPAPEGAEAAAEARAAAAAAEQPRSGETFKTSPMVDVPGADASSHEDIAYQRTLLSVRTPDVPDARPAEAEPAEDQPAASTDAAEPTGDTAQESEPAAGDTAPLPEPKPTTEPMRAAAITGDVKHSTHGAVDAAPHPLPAKPPAKSRAGKRRGVVIGLFATGIAAAAAVAVVVKTRGSDPGSAQAVTAAWEGKVTELATGPGSDGLAICNAQGEACQAATKDAIVPTGAVLKTDATTRARVALSDGTLITVDRNTELKLSAKWNRRAMLQRGALVAQVEKQDGSTARFDTPLGHAEVLGTKLALSTTYKSTTVDVTRGSVKLSDKQSRSVTVRAGEEGRVQDGIAPFAANAPAIGAAVAWSESLNETEDEAVPLRGLGELRAKKPGEKSERKGAVSLTSHKVSVRIVENIARTQIEEVFTNSTDDVLEGIFRFPLPPDAQIENLALEVDGKLKNGAFLDRDRAAAIWRGTIVNAAPKLRKTIKEEIIWVPGPWRDPALLEWKRGGRFELRIFPIPKRGSRRIVLTYTQVVQPTAGVRRYTYPLAHDPSGSTQVANFNVDVQVQGHDPAFGVQAAGYALKPGDSRGGAEGLTWQKANFKPAGDLVLEYALPNRNSEITAWAYQPTDEDVAKQTGTKDAPAKKTDQSDDGVTRKSPYVALALRPKLPRTKDAQARSFVVVVDSSRSMIGERYSRATTLAARFIKELDRGDTFTVMACDTTCRQLPGGPQSPSGTSAADAKTFLDTLTPEGGSDVAGAIAHAAKAGAASGGRALRVVYIGDGTPTVGAIRPAYVTREVKQAIGAGTGTVTTVAIGADADADTLGAVARGGGGVALPYVPGQRTAEAAYAVLGATYGTTLRDVEVTLPPGLTAVAPKRIDTIAAGAETIVVARMSQPSVGGDVVVRGKVGDKPFERTLTVALKPTSAKGNAFVPRLYAAAAIGDLEKDPSEDAKKQAVALSSEFSVASRHTSLLVLESQAMFKAFGLDNSRRAPTWTGEDAAESTVGASPDDAASDEDADDSKDAFDGASGSTASGGGGFGQGSKGESSQPGFAPPPSAAPPARKSTQTAKKAKKPASARRQDLDVLGGDPWEPPRSRPRPRRMIPMRRIFERKATIITGRKVPAKAVVSKLLEAERKVQTEPNNRTAVQDLFTLYALSGNAGRAQQVAERWSTKDPLDPAALTARADVAASSGKRELAIRILGSVVDVRPEDIASQKRLARLHRWAGRPELGCRHALAIAQIRSRDAKLLTQAVRCARETGMSSMGDDMLRAADKRTRAVAEQLLKKNRRKDTLRGTFKVEATWAGAGGADLDLAILHPDGHRVSWLGAPTKSVITATDVKSLSREGLALGGAKNGEYVIEVVRAAGAGPVSGTLTINAAGSRKTIPFTLVGQRTTVAITKFTTTSRLVPVRRGWGGGGWRRGWR